MLRFSQTFVFILVTICLSGQVQITDVGPIPSNASDCIVAFQSQSVQVVSSMTCTDPLDILYDKTGPIMGLGSTVASFSGSYILQFDSIGIYSFVCSSKGIADQCFYVLEAPTTPTLGEWAIINLAILLLIFGVVAQKSLQLT